MSADTDANPPLPHCTRNISLHGLSAEGLSPLHTERRVFQHILPALAHTAAVNCKPSSPAPSPSQITTHPEHADPLPGLPLVVPGPGRQRHAPLTKLGTMQQPAGTPGQRQTCHNPPTLRHQGHAFTTRDHKAEGSQERSMRLQALLNANMNLPQGVLWLCMPVRQGLYSQLPL